MRKEIILSDNTLNTVLKEIRDFILDVGVYTIYQDITTYTPNSAIPHIRSSYTYFIVYNKLDEIYLTFFGLDNGYVSLIVSSEIDNGESIFWQKDVCTNGTMQEYKSDISSGVDYTSNKYVLYPLPTIYSPTKLVLNYNSDHNTYMISAINQRQVNYQDYVDETCANCTTSIFFGDIAKWCDIEGQFFCGGDFICTYELVHRSRVSMVSKSALYMYSDVYIVLDAMHTDLHWHSQIHNGGYAPKYPWIDHPESNYDCYMFSPAKPNNNTLFNVEVFLYAKVDNAPHRDKRSLVGSKLILNGSFDQNKSQVKELEQTNIWCTTLELPYYMRLVTTLDINSTTTVPTYWPLYCRSINEMGHDVNTLNCITLALPMYFMVMRDPQALKNYSCVGVSNVLRYVNMYNMGTNHLKNGNYPVDTNKYNCFQTGVRRNMFGLLGYNGIAFRQEKEENG